MKSKTLEDDSDIVRNKGSIHQAGKIIKGTMNQAQGKTKVSSIPNKFQNLIYQSHTKPAFGESSKRFYNSLNNQNGFPGPGQYNFNKFSRTQSKKGSGFFASSTKLTRMERVRSHVPGPGSYKNQQFKPKKTFHRQKTQSTFNKFSTTNSSKSVAVLSSQLQTRDLFKFELLNASDKPSVGQYNINIQKEAKQDHSYAFKSKLDRFKVSEQKSPPIGTYQVEYINENKDKIKKFERAKSKDQSEFERQKKIEFAIKNVDRNQLKQKIGPGTYEPLQTKNSKFFKIRQTMYDRFGQLKPIYKMAKTIEPASNNLFLKSQLINNSKTNIPNSIFKSTTQRWGVINQHQMDPGVYNPRKSPAKSSHLINFTQKWV